MSHRRAGGPLAVLERIRGGLPRSGRHRCTARSRRNPWKTGEPAPLNQILQIREPLLRHVLAVWQAAADTEAGSDALSDAGRPRVPGRAAVDPVALGRALAHVWLVEQEPGTGRLRYRLAGEGINEVYRRNLAGLYLEDIIPAAGFAVVERRYRDVLHTPALLRTSGMVYVRNERSLVGERLILPLLSAEAAAAGGEPDLLLGATVHKLAPLKGAPPEQETVFARLRPLAGDRGWVEDRAGERIRTLT